MWGGGGGRSGRGEGKVDMVLSHVWLALFSFLVCLLTKRNEHFLDYRLVIRTSRLLNVFCSLNTMTQDIP